MKVDQKGHTTIIKDTQNNLEAFVEKINNAYNTFQGQNLILDISHDKAISNADLAHFKDLAKNHKKAKKSILYKVMKIGKDMKIYSTLRTI